MELGVNIDHVATLRQARGTVYPDPIEAARIAEEAGADLITLHLREDRRHIVDRDIEILRGRIQTRMNLEMAATDEMVEIACRVRVGTFRAGCRGRTPARLPAARGRNRVPSIGFSMCRARATRS